MAITLLIVDDSMTMRSVIKKTVQMSGFEADTYLEAGSGAEAIITLAKKRVDLILSDINMPEMTGIQMLKRLKSEPHFATIPVIMISTEGSEERIREAMDAGASGYLKKPFQPEEIRALLEENLGD